MINCYKCNKTLTLTAESTLSRRDVCEFCGTDLRVCKMCQHWDAKSYNECREPSAERQVDKEKSNFCDFFKLKLTPETVEELKRKQLEKAMALFKK